MRPPHFRALLPALAVALLVTVSCGSQPQAVDESQDTYEMQPQAADAPAAEDAPNTLKNPASEKALDVVAVLEKIQPMPSGSEGFREPSADEKLAFQRAFERALMAPRNAPAELAPLGFSGRFLKDKSGAEFVVLSDTQNRGAGTYVLALNPSRNLVLEAPHADYDKGTLRQTAEQLVLLNARALLITGTHRCANAAATPCLTGTTRACNGALRVSDAAHYSQSYFMAAHQAARSMFPDSLALSVHGMEGGDGEVAMISDGTNELRSGPSVQLKELLIRAFGQGGIFSCNAASDSGHAALCGTTNVQGRFDNLSAEACTQKAPSSTGRFLHLEQAPSLRDPANTRKVAQALAELVPCTLGGTALGCGF